jgi:hypothetical protein
MLKVGMGLALNGGGCMKRTEAEEANMIVNDYRVLEREAELELLRADAAKSRAEARLLNAQAAEVEEGYCGADEDSSYLAMQALEALDNMAEERPVRSGPWTPLERSAFEKCVHLLKSIIEG